MSKVSIRESRGRSRAVAVVAMVVFVALLTVGASASSEPKGDAKLASGFGARLAKVQKAVDGVAKAGARQTTMTPQQVLASLGRKPSAQQIFFYVRDNISFEPYDGQLRGPRGTLMARSGNAADQAVLLFELLTMRKIPARVAYGKRSVADGALLLGSLVGSAGLAGRDLPEKATAYDPSKDRVVLNAARSAYWVEAKVKGKWVAMDPSNPRGVYGVAPATKVGETEGVPDKAQVRLTIKLVAKDSGGGTSEVYTSTVPMDDVSYRNISISFVESAGSTIPRVALGGKVQQGQKFSRDKLTRLTLRLLFERGGKTENKVVRDLYMKGSAVDLMAADKQVFSVVVTPGWVPDDFVALAGAQGMAKMVSDGVEVAQLVSGAVKKTERDHSVNARLDAYADDSLGQAAGLIALAYALVSDRTTVALAGQLGVRPFFSEPRVIIVAAVVEGGRLFWHMDLRTDRIHAVPAAGLPLELAAAMQTARGAIDAELEGIVTSKLTGRPVLSAGAVMGLASKGRVPLETVVANNVKSSIKKLEVSKEAQGRVKFLVSKSADGILVPRKAIKVGDASVSAWWQIDPSSGAIVGVREDGSHGGFEQSLLTGAKKLPPRTGDARVLVLDELITLFENLAPGLRAAVGGGPSGCSAVCASMDHTKVVSEQLCGGKADARSCLAGEGASGGGDLLGKTLSCQEVAREAKCGAAVATEALSGAYTFTQDKRPAEIGPWSFKSLARVGAKACRCR